MKPRRPAARSEASNRRCGIGLAATIAVVGAVVLLASAQVSAWLFVISGALLVAALITPKLLSPLDAAWERLTNSITLPHIRIPSAIRIVWWNAALIAAGLLLIGLLAEGWFRLRAPFTDNSAGWNRLDPVTGLIHFPDTEIRITNKFDYWTVTRTNSLGFLDREPPDPERAAASCHIAAIGDSLVDAPQVDIEDKFQVRLEEVAARELPGLDVTTSAFGIRATGQTHQLPWHDAYVRPLRPNVVALVFVDNDFRNNSPALHVIVTGYGPDAIPYATARRSADGTIRLRPPSLDIEGERLAPFRDYPLILRFWRNTPSLLIDWIGRQMNFLINWRIAPFRARAEEISRRPGYESMLEGWDPAGIVDYSLGNFFSLPDPPPIFQEGFEFTGFALDEFVRRTERDGAELVILASHTMGPSGAPMFERLAAMAGERGIPVINQYDYIERQGGNVEDVRFSLDHHWNAQGHQWAAEALLEWLRENPQVCDDGDGA